MAARHFTRDEAEELLPFLAPLLFKLRGLKGEHDRLQDAISDLGIHMRTNGHGLAGELGTAQQSIKKTADQITKLVERISDMGCELKDIDRGLIDFRTIVGDREVYLCWMLGEEHVAYWHDLDAGFAGRRPLEELGG